MGREEIFIDLGGGVGAARQKRRLFTQNSLKFRIFTVFAACDGHDGWLADP